MIKIILKNLWNRRGRYAWLFIELVIVTCVGWYVIDEAAVSLQDSMLPLGYDSERLVVVDVANLVEGNKGFAEAESDSLSRIRNFNRLLDKVRAYPGVEQVSANDAAVIINGQFTNLNNFRAGVPADTTVGASHVMTFLPGQHFFETYGIEALPGYPSAEELSARSYSPYEYVITEDLAKLYWPDGDYHNRAFMNVTRNGDTLAMPVVGVVHNVRFHSPSRSRALAFKYYESDRYPFDEATLVLRLAPGTDVDAFVHDFHRWAAKKLRTGNYYCKTVTAHSDLVANVEVGFGVSAHRSTMLCLAAFFLINLVLGVTASFYLQARRRVGEMGVHRSFGARRAHIVAMLMGEAAVLATLAVAVGCAIYLQYALKSGLAEGYNHNEMLNLITTPLSSFASHFAIISGIVYVLILLCTLLGSYLPARKVSRVEPVDALRDE
ncbi:MAG: FtsX-like permease family protein [Muribaculaceae bacterium]|nr:FtsX-like permease family protein [Muribaculaceae bacterium]